MARKAETRLQKALASSRRRATSLRKQLKENPVTDTVGIAAGGALAGVVPQYLPTEMRTIAGLPTTSLIGVGLVVYSTTGKTQTKLASQLGQGMIAVAAAQYASTFMQGE